MKQWLPSLSIKNGQSASYVFEADTQITYNPENVDVLRLMKKKKVRA